MDLSKHMLFQSVRLVGAVGIEPMSETWAVQLHNAPLQRRPSCWGLDDARKFQSNFGPVQGRDK